MRNRMAIVLALLGLSATGLAPTADARPFRHHGLIRYAHVYGRVGFASSRYAYGFGRRDAYGVLRYYPPLSGTVGTPIPRYAARFMGYPYNVPGYRYEYADACLLRVGGVFGPGPSVGPCPFGLDRPF